MQVLQFCKKTPIPPKDGESIAIHQLSNAFVENDCKLTVFSLLTQKHGKNDSNQYIKNVDYFFQKIDTSISYISMLKNIFFSKKSYIVNRFFDKKVNLKLIELLKNNKFDLIHLEGVFLAYYIPTIRKYSDAKISLRAHNLEFKIWDRFAENESFFKKWYLKNILIPRLRKLENDTANNVDCIIPISKVDEQYFRNLNINKPILTIPAAFKVKEDVKTLPYKFNIGFIGSLDWLPNTEGVDWFLRTVWNEFVKIKTDATFNLAGRNFPKKYFDLQDEKIIIFGEIDDAKEFTLNNSIMVAPILSGSGMRIKIIEALALGRTVLSTTVGAEGIDYTNNINIFIADTAEEWISILLKLYENKEFLNSVGKAGQELVEKKHNTTKLGKELIDFYKKEVL